MVSDGLVVGSELQSILFEFCYEFFLGVVPLLNLRSILGFVGESCPPRGVALTLVGSGVVAVVEHAAHGGFGLSMRLASNRPGRVIDVERLLDRRAWP